MADEWMCFFGHRYSQGVRMVAGIAVMVLLNLGAAFVDHCPGRSKRSRFG